MKRLKNRDKLMIKKQHEKTQHERHFLFCDTLAGNILI